MPASKPTILIVDDEHRICRSLQILLQEDGLYATETATDYYQAIEKLKKPVDLVLTDLTMPGKTGLDLLSTIKKETPHMPVLLMTAYSTVDSAVNAMKEGAADYIKKPFDNDDLLRLIRKTLAACGKAPSEPLLRARFGDMIGESPIMQEVYRRITRAAETDSTVLITGESGTGKELVARAIHFSGSRKSKAFIAINCAALPETLLESELFGHQKGSFTGALRDKEGKFELAHEGTIFLDEIGEMSPALQAKLLRVIQEKEFERVGGEKSIRVNVRIIAATNRNLEKAVKENLFREDLYYRLNVLTMEVPTLRDRKQDLPLLIEHFLEEKSRKLSTPKKSLSKSAMDFLLSYNYPGNIRELENMIERAVVICATDVIDVRDLPSRGTPPQNDWTNTAIPILGGMEALEQIKLNLEKDVIERALAAYPEKSNTELAELLGTSRRVLEIRLKQFGLQKRKAN